MWGNISNIQWTLAIGILILALMKREPGEKGWLGLEAAYLVGAGLTGPFSILAFPIYVLRAYVTRNRYDRILTAVVGVCAAIQAAPLLATPTEVPHATFPPSLWWQVPMSRIFGTLFLGTAQTFQVSGTFFYAVVSIALVVWIAVEGKWKLQKCAIALFLLINLSAVLWKFHPALMMLTNMIFGDRYFYIPRVMILWLMIVALDDVAARPLGVTVLLLAALTTLHHPARFRRPLQEWAAYADRVNAGEPVEIPINPGWKIILPARR